MLKKVTQLVLPLIVSFTILALLLTLFNSGLSDAERPSVFNTLSNTNATLLFAYLLISIVTLFIRAYRYRLLIHICGEIHLPTFKQMLLVTGIRNMIVDLLPSRIGELGYVGLLNRGYGVKLQHCISSLAISIAFDFMAVLMVVMAIVSLQVLGGDLQGWALGAMLMVIIICAIAFIGLFFLAPAVNAQLQKRLPASSNDSIWAKCLNLSNDLAISLSTARNAGKTRSLIGLSFSIRLLKYLGLFCLFQAVVQSNYPELAMLKIEHTFGALIGGEIGASLPVPTFMSFGAYEAGGALVFHLLGVANQAAAFVALLSVHIWSQILDYLLGGLCLLLFIKFRPRSVESNVPLIRSEPHWKHKASLAILLVSLLFAALFFALQLHKTSKLGAIAAPSPGAIQNNFIEQQASSKESLAKLEGFVVFSSNRDGNHDIFKISLPTMALSKLTSHPHTETYPRISPDGQFLVFARAHQTWVSQRNTQAWDVVLLNLSTGAEKIIAHNATAPAWVNNQQISFVSKSTSLILYNTDSGVSKTLYTTGVNNPMPAGSEIHNAKYNQRTSEISFTGRQRDIKMNKGSWGTAIAQGNQHQGVHNGCELSWSHDTKRLFQVHPSTGNNNSNRIVSVNQQTLELSTLIDLEGEFSHEYWPQESANGKVMVFGASRSSKEHEHDVADYEIFLWQAGNKPSDATRLTFHSGNDNWPDVFISN